jgi:hypothetical protein
MVAGEAHWFGVRRTGSESTCSAVMAVLPSVCATVVVQSEIINNASNRLMRVQAY